MKKIKTPEEILEVNFYRPKDTLKYYEYIVDCMEQYGEQYKNLMGLDNPFPLKDVLKKLVDAADILLYKKNYDGANYEEIEICIKRAKEIIKLCEKI